MPRGYNPKQGHLRFERHLIWLTKSKQVLILDTANRKSQEVDDHFTDNSRDINSCCGEDKIINQSCILQRKLHG